MESDKHMNGEQVNSVPKPVGPNLGESHKISSNHGGNSIPGVLRNVSKKRTGCPQNMGVSDSANIVSAPQMNSHTTAQKPKLTNLLEDQKFMADFDPENSSRNQLKKKKRYHPIDGRLIQYASDFDVCDCLQTDCEGCHSPCVNCQGSRCGHDCRENRRWIYETIKIEGRNETLRHPHADSFSSV